tara:strand:+ start:1615 stop:2829 length:1215 start_codon:yes stop_codon:yes gene_type:complete
MNKLLHILIIAAVFLLSGCATNKMKSIADERFTKLEKSTLLTLVDVHSKAQREEDAVKYMLALGEIKHRYNLPERADSNVEYDRLKSREFYKTRFQGKKLYSLSNQGRSDMLTDLSIMHKETRLNYTLVAADYLIQKALNGKHILSSIDIDDVRSTDKAVSELFSQDVTGYFHADELKSLRVLTLISPHHVEVNSIDITSELAIAAETILAKTDLKLTDDPYLFFYNYELYYSAAKDLYVACELSEKQASYWLEDSQLDSVRDMHEFACSLKTDGLTSDSKRFVSVEKRKGMRYSLLSNKLTYLFIKKDLAGFRYAIENKESKRLNLDDRDSAGLTFFERFSKEWQATTSDSDYDQLVLFAAAIAAAGEDVTAYRKLALDFIDKSDYVPPSDPHRALLKATSID